MSDPLPPGYNKWSIIWFTAMMSAFAGAVVAAWFGLQPITLACLGIGAVIFWSSQRHLQGMLQQRARESNPRGD